MSLLRVGLVLVAAVAAAVVANVVLLGVATGSNERVGNLSPNAAIVTRVSPAASAVPAKPSPPSGGELRERGGDD
jgi:hypothetical protein